MATGATIEFRGITKHFGAVHAVEDLTFSVEPGMVTGFLGPNGSGKTTTLRMLLGLVTPTSGTATIGGSAYRDLERPLSTVGTALEASSFHPGRSARNHLAVYAAAEGIGSKRVADVLTRVGLGEYMDRRVGGYSLGMRQRLGLAFALLGDPGVLVLDEPTNGLDPEGIRWMRGFLRSEVQQCVDRVVIISRGRSMYEGSLESLESGSVVHIDSPNRSELTKALTSAGARIESTDAALLATGITAERAGAAAFAAGVALSHLSVESVGLEHVFLELVGTDSQPEQAGAPS
jgi:ABC-2 type transport system ATP-binding protein